MSSVGQVVGGAIGFFAAGPLGVSAVMGAQAGIMLGGLIDPPKGPNIVGPRLSDLSVQTSTYGAPLPRIYGTVATFGNIFWLEGDKIKETSKKNKSGGKGGGGGSTTKTFSYSATFAVGLCEGPIDGIRRLWVGSKLIYDAGSDDIDTIIASNESANGFRLYLGTDDQSPDPRMQADKGVANTPAYRGRAYIVMYDFPLADYGNSLMAAQVKAEVVKIKSPGETAPYYFHNEPFAHSNASTSVYFDGATIQISTSANTNSATADPIAVNYYRYHIDGRVISSYQRMIDSPYAPGGSWLIWPVQNEPEAYIFQKNGDNRLYRNGAVSGTILNHTGAPWNSGGISRVAIIDGFMYAYSGSISSRFYIYKYDVNNVEFGPVARVEPPEYLSGGQITSFRVSDTRDGYLMVELGREIMRYDYDLNLIAQWEVDNGPTNNASPFIYKNYLGLINNPAIGSYNIYEVDDSGGLVGASDLWGTFNTTPNTQFLFSLGNGFVVTPTGLLSLLDTYNDNLTDLATIVSAEVENSAILGPSDYDVTDLVEDVRGYRVAQPGAIRGAIDPLQAAWPFDIVQSGYQIKFLRRGKASVATIPATHLDARPFGDAPTQELMTVREMDLQLPREVSLKYLDVNREYDQGEQRDARMNTEAINRRDLDLAIVMNADEAKQTAEVLLYLWWLERYDASFRLPPEYIGLEPADVITVTGKWGEYELRLTTISYLPDGRLECQAKYNTATIYTSTAVGEEGSSGGATIGLAGPSAYRLLDIPLLTDSLNTPGFPAAMSGYTESWPGGVIFRSGDGGQTFDDIQGFTAPVSMAFARGTIGAGPTNVIDAASVLTVDVLSGDLESVSELQMLNGANHFAYGADGRWEIIAAQSAVEQADGSFLLTNFLRGRFGTEWAMTTHVAGDALVLVSDPDMAWIAMNSGLIGQSRTYRGVTVGKDISSDSDREFTYQGVNLKPLSPVYLNGNRHPSTNAWTLTWIRRGRVSPEWRNLVDVPLGEETEAYEIDVFEDGAYTTVVRTISVTAQTAAYSSADQVADFGSNQSTLYLRIYQMSAAVGRGYPLQTSITR